MEWAHGKVAEEKSAKVICNLEKLLNTGFKKDSMLDVLNSMMNLEKNEDVFATLDVSIFDPQNGNTEFVKLSACPTYIKKKDDIEIIQSISLPVGILDDIDSSVYDKVLEKDDIIIMVTDGVLEAHREKDENWLINLLKSLNTENPQRLADIILQEALDNSFGIAKDDMTVIVARVK